MKENIFCSGKPIERKNFDEVVTLWKNGEITAVEAMKRLDMKSSTFYRKVNKYLYNKV